MPHRTQSLQYNPLSLIRRTRPIKASQKKNLYDLPSHIKSLMVEKHRIRSCWYRSGLPSNNRTLNHLSSTIKRLIKTHKIDYFRLKYQSLNTQDNLLQKATKKLLKIKNHSHSLKEDELLAISDKEKKYF